MELLRNVYILHPTRGLKCSGCNLGKYNYSNGYHCYRSGLFFHKECAKSRLEISNLYHPQHSLHIKVAKENEDVYGECKICRGNLPKMYYYCSICDFAIDLICVKKEVIVAIDGPKIHMHSLTLVPEMIKFTCHLCGILDDRFPYVCNLCDLSFHKDCAESTPELNYSCHPKHLLKFLARVPSYINGKCCLCQSILHNVFYHCYTCNFSIDINCAKNPPPFTLVNLKAHEHSLILMPQRNFICNACGMDDDSNPYVCSQCNFMIHRNCIDLPRIIKINRHNHRIYYNNCLNVRERECVVCYKEIIWTYGAYCCLQCPEFAIHLRCATKFGIWDGIELEGVSENTIEVKSYEIIEEGVIKHFSHGNHFLKLKEEYDARNDDMLCQACIYPILSSPFYICMECDDFILHQKCAYLPKRKIDSFSKMPITLIPKVIGGSLSPIIVSVDYKSFCAICQSSFNGFCYKSDNNEITLDTRCGSISEPYFHESHPSHSLYIDYPSKDRFCNACGDKSSIVLCCEECGFVLDIKCSILPKMVRHKNDKDHFLYLCYGENTSKLYWCEMCEEKINSEKWFYSCDDCAITLHIKCTLGDFMWHKEGIHEKMSTYYVILNNRVTRPICNWCDSRCQFPSILKYRKQIFCSSQCFGKKVQLVLLDRGI